MQLRVVLCALVVVVVVIAAKTPAAYATQERRRKPAPRAELLLPHSADDDGSDEPEMLIFGSKRRTSKEQRTPADGGDEVAPTAAARRRQQIARRYDDRAAVPTPFMAQARTVSAAKDRSSYVVTPTPRFANQEENIASAELSEERLSPARPKQRSRYLLPLPEKLSDAAPKRGRAISMDGANSNSNFNWLPFGHSGAAARRKAHKATTTSTTTTTTTTTTTSRPNLFENLQLRNPFNIFSPNFWNPSTTPSPAAKHPPKKYHNAATTVHTPSKEEKLLAIQKPKMPSHAVAARPTAMLQAATSTAKEDGPFRIALPTLNLLGAAPQRSLTASAANEKEKRAALAAASLRERFNCPRESEVRFQLFPKICTTDPDCSVWNRNELCCEIFGAKSCVSGIPKPLEESSHAPLLGVIARKCPTRPLAELWWDVQECSSDEDCWPRICCPDGRRRYCRTSQPELETAPVPVKRSFNYLTEYLECTAPPPPIFDLHPKACTSTLDCFPNVCCQEAGLRHCRPPKKSVLTLMANFLNVDFVKRLTQNIVIK